MLCQVCTTHSSAFSIFYQPTPQHCNYHNTPTTDQQLITACACVSQPPTRHQQLITPRACVGTVSIRIYADVLTSSCVFEMIAYKSSSVKRDDSQGIRQLWWRPLHILHELGNGKGAARALIRAHALFEVIKKSPISLYSHFSYTCINNGWN